MSKELNPSPKIPSGKADEQIITKTLGVDYGTLSPNPNYTDGYIDGGRGVGTPTNPNQEPKKQVTGVGLSEEDVIALIKRYTENTVESYPVADGILEMDSNEHPLTPEIQAFLDKCFKAGKISVGGSLCNLNYEYTERNGDTYYCYGCMTTNNNDAHKQYGTHIEIYVDKELNKYTCYDSEI